MLISPMAPAHMALPPHEHQPLLMQEAAGLQTGPSITQPLKPAVQIGLKQVNTKLVFFEYPLNHFSRMRINGTGSSF
jgi:hypothetical protein